MHSDLKDGLPKDHSRKIRVASFGEFKTKIESSEEINLDFEKKYSDWLLTRSNEEPSIIFIGAYSKYKNIELLLAFIKQNKKNSALIIAPKLSENENDQTSSRIDDNVFLYTDKKVDSEVKDLLKTKGIIGYVGHDNLSVPTSIYMFASYGIPMVGFDSHPVNSILEEYQIGELFSSNDSLQRAIDLVQENYNYYSNNTGSFLKDNNWEMSRNVHRDSFMLS